MIDVKKAISKSQTLINRFVNLSLCRDKILDKRHQWFYSLIDKESLLEILPELVEEDIRQDIYLFIIQLAKNSNLIMKDFCNVLKVQIGWFLRDRLNYLIKQRKLWKDLQSDILLLWGTPVSPTNLLNLRWVLYSEDIPLTSYEKYILYLHLYRCYTLQEISEIVYQDRKSVGHTLKDALDTVRNFIYA